jgi:hydroxymethylpyrimidine kinase/phosphomethylpyrimidine kinase/thiamine-phosphate diphosphorylase
VCITGGEDPDLHGRVLDWLASPEADGWIAAPRVATPHTHGTGCTFASAAAAALALGFVPADAAVLAKMATTHALRHGHAAGAGAGPVHACVGFATDPTLLPLMSWGEEPCFAPPRPAPSRRLGLYAIVDSAERVAQVIAAGVRTVQLRIKTPSPAGAWPGGLRAALQASIAACRSARTELFVNDHWELARELGAGGVHLGQEDLLGLGESGRRSLMAGGTDVGVSSHSLWELCRARSLSPRYIACGPVWPTLTKAMPWRPQGLDNLAWWRQMAGAPVVAIGGILEAVQVRDAAQCGVDGVCVVRALGDDPAASVAALQRAMDDGRIGPVTAARGLPHPTLQGG